MKITLAWIKCWWHCLIHTFDGHCMLVGRNGHEIGLIAAVKTNGEIQKIFFNTNQTVTGKIRK